MGTVATREVCAGLLMSLGLALGVCVAQVVPDSIQLPDGSFYHGALSNGLFEGAGVLIYGDGDRYEGDFRQGRMDGTGVLRYASGGFYTGGFRRGRSEGIGTEVLRNGDRYQGGFKDDAKSGTGVYTTANGDTYRGDFNGGLFDGTGVLKYANGNIYEGPFRNGERQGRGILRYQDGGRYEGLFSNGCFEGRGVMHYPNGDKYEGEFKGGQIEEGQGSYSHFPRGMVVLGLMLSLMANGILAWRLRKAGRAQTAGRDPVERDDGSNAASPGGTAPEDPSLKKVFTAPSVVPCDLLKGLLEGRGIKVLIKNERGSAGAGVGDPVPYMPSATFAWPEVWVSVADAEVAELIVAEMKRSELSPESPWKCARCGEMVGAELGVCWNCETPRPQ